MKKLLVLFSLFFVLIYCSGAFYYTTFNPSLWPQDARFIVLVGWLTLIFLTCITAAAFDAWDYKRATKNQSK